MGPRIAASGRTNSQRTAAGVTPPPASNDGWDAPFFKANFNAPPSDVQIGGATGSAQMWRPSSLERSSAPGFATTKRPTGILAPGAGAGQNQAVPMARDSAISFPPPPGQQRVEPRVSSDPNPNKSAVPDSTLPSSVPAVDSARVTAASVPSAISLVESDSLGPHTAAMPFSQPGVEARPQTEVQDLAPGATTISAIAPRPVTAENSVGSTTGEGTTAAGLNPNMVVPSVAVSEDLAYVHRGSSLQTYSITGSVLVSVSGVPLRLQVTDEDGHIATANANPAFAEEVVGTTPPKREYTCKVGAEQTGLVGAKFLPALMYRCSAAVKVLPVRVTCRLRTAGSAVLVWVQVIANPQNLQLLGGVSVMVHLPFSLRKDEVRAKCTGVSMCSRS